MFTPFNLNQIELSNAIIANINEQNPDANIDVALYNKILNASTEVVNECARSRVYAEGNSMSPAEWLASDDVGESSRFMITQIAGIGIQSDYGARPYDAADLGRCIRMVEACNLQDNVHKMRGKGKVWDMIVNNWDKLLELYKKEDSKTIYQMLNQ